MPGRNKLSRVLRHSPCTPRQPGPPPKPPSPRCSSLPCSQHALPPFHRPEQAPCAHRAAQPQRDVQAHAPRVPPARGHRAQHAALDTLRLCNAHTHPQRHTRVLTASPPCTPQPCGTRWPRLGSPARPPWPSHAPAGYTNRLPGAHAAGRTLASLTPTNHTGSPRCSPAHARPCRKRHWLPAAFSLH